MKVGRLILLSKLKETDTPTVDNTRPIVIKTHLMKVMEKMIISKIKYDKNETIR